MNGRGFYNPKQFEEGETEIKYNCIKQKKKQKSSCTYSYEKNITKTNNRCY